MNKAAEAVYTAIRRDGHQNVVDLMQTREELYDRIGYHEFESKLDACSRRTRAVPHRLRRRRAAIRRARLHCIDHPASKE